MSPEPTGPARVAHQFELAMAVRHSADVPDEMMAAIVRDALASDDIGRFVVRQAALTVGVADVAEGMIAKLFANRRALQAALARLDAGDPVKPAEYQLSGDDMLRHIGRSVSEAG